MATTGHRGDADRIVQISLCRTDTLKARTWTVSTWGVESTLDAFAEHGVKFAKTEMSFDITKIWYKIEEFCGGLPILSHNAQADQDLLWKYHDNHKIRFDNPSTSWPIGGSILELSAATLLPEEREPESRNFELGLTRRPCQTGFQLK